MKTNGQTSPETSGPNGKREKPVVRASQPIVNKGELPDLFAWPDGRRIRTAEEWPARARAWRDLLVEIEYGGLPPRPDRVEVEILCRTTLETWPSDPGLWSYRIHCSGGIKPFSFTARILFPASEQPVPALLNGDGCWWYVTEKVAQAVLERGYALVLFNRTEMAEDLGYKGVPDKRRRQGGLYDVYPGLTFGALAAWAWGYHRVVDSLHQFPFIDTRFIAVTGHSRGGKTVLLAGATDERITLINDNAACAGGAPVYRYVGDGGETLNIANVFPSWFGPRLASYVGREEELPFDQHALLAVIAPRPLLMTYSTDDRWSNPEGMVQSVWAARQVYSFLGQENNIAFHLRRGPHCHSPEDWNVLLDFVDWKWKGHPPTAPYNVHPYSNLVPVFSWKAPS